MISAAKLPAFVSYDQATGIFRGMRTHNKYKAGETIGHVDKRGYFILKFDGKAYKGHRVAWALMTGEWPKLEIDHRNGITDDNRWENLRQATRIQNMSNRKLNKNTGTGLKGVSARGNRYRAYINSHGKRTWLGNYDSPEAAHQAYLAKAAELHGEFARAA